MDAQNCTVFPVQSFNPGVDCDTTRRMMNCDSVTCRWRRNNGTLALLIYSWKMEMVMAGKDGELITPGLTNGNIHLFHPGWTEEANERLESDDTVTPIFALFPFIIIVIIMFVCFFLDSTWGCWMQTCRFSGSCLAHNVQLKKKKKKMHRKPPKVILFTISAFFAVI